MAGVISYPTGLDYQQALYNTDIAFRDPALRGGAPVRNQFDMPKAIGGNFADNREDGAMVIRTHIERRYVLFNTHSIRFEHGVHCRRM